MARSMKMRRPAVSKWKHASATLVLLLWVGALFICSAECLSHRCHSNLEGVDRNHQASHPPVSHSHKDPEHQHDAPAEGSNDTDFCDSLRAITLKGNLNRLTMAPQFTVIFTVIWMLNSTTGEDLQTATPDSLPIRQSERPDQVFTHEVCTSPANRSQECSSSRVRRLGGPAF